jgi:hypothetical protein
MSEICNSNIFSFKRYIYALLDLRLIYGMLTMKYFLTYCRYHNSNCSVHRDPKFVSDFGVSACLIAAKELNLLSL